MSIRFVLTINIFIIIVKKQKNFQSSPKINFYYYSAHQKFKALAPEKVGHNRNAKLPMAKILQYPELRVNPFGDRICKVFSSSQDGDCTFEDFLDMMSVFSDAAPKAVKAEHAFRIFGSLKQSKTKVTFFFLSTL